MTATCCSIRVQAYDVIFLEECTQFPENVFTTMTESNRSSGLMAEHFPPRMYFTCNPGGVGHAWFKRLSSTANTKDLKSRNTTSLFRRMCTTTRR